MAFERVKSLGHQSVHAMVFGGAVVFLILHALFDGIALGNGAQEGGRFALSAGGPAPQVARGVADLVAAAPRIWQARRQRRAWQAWGSPRLAGFLLEGQLHHLFDGAGFACLQAFVAGSLLHVIAHQNDHQGHDHDHEHDHDHAQACAHPRWESVGAGLGVGLVALLPVLESWYVAGHASHISHPQSHGMVAVGGYGHRLLDLFLESAPGAAAWVRAGRGVCGLSADRLA